MSEKNPVPPHIREMVFERENNACVVCGRTGEEVSLHLHHRKPEQEGGTNDPSNLTVLCSEDHAHYHSNRELLNGIQTDLDDYDLSMTQADYKIVAVLESVAPASTGEIAKAACLSAEHARRRLYALSAAGVVAPDLNQQWDFSENVEESAQGQLPESPNKAARFARDDCIRRMRDHGMPYATIAEIVGLDERTIPVAINRARAFDPPLPPANSTTPDLVDIERRVASLERQLDSD